MRCVEQDAIPIINYNDTVSFEENRRWELEQLRSRSSGREKVVECIDNDETASVISTLVHPRYLLILPPLMVFIWIHPILLHWFVLWRVRMWTK